MDTIDFTDTGRRYSARDERLCNRRADDRPDFESRTSTMENTAPAVVSDDPLPGKHALLAACRGDADTSHPLLLWAGQLAALHEHRLACGADDMDRIDRRRSLLVHNVDRWVCRELPPSHGGALVHTETLGTVIDRVAQFTAYAFAALAGSTGWNLHDAWEQLATLAVAYEDLRTEVSAGRRRLPGGP